MGVRFHMLAESEPDSRKGVVCVSPRRSFKRRSAICPDHIPNTRFLSQELEVAIMYEECH